MSFGTLDHPIRWLLVLHALAGLIALLFFSIPLFTKKGGKLHIRTGWIYIFSMVIVGFTTFIIAPWRAFYDPSRTQDSQGFAVFLFFISILTLSSIWFGLRVLKFKERKDSNKQLLQIGPGILLIVCGVGTQFVGYFINNPLLMIFPFLGYTTAWGQIRYWIKTPQEKKHWLYSHINGMGVACISTVTAFLVTALPRISNASLFHSPILWIAPGVIGGFLASKLIARYKAKFEDS